MRLGKGWGVTGTCGARVGVRIRVTVSVRGVRSRLGSLGLPRVHTVLLQSMELTYVRVHSS